MSDVFQRHTLRQSLTLWEQCGRTDYGDPVFSAPVAIRGRWSQRSELFRGRNGQEVRSSAVVHVDRDIAEGSYLLLGSSTESDPKAVSGALEVQGFSKVPQLYGSQCVRKAYL